MHSLQRLADTKDTRAFSTHLLRYGFCYGQEILGLVIYLHVLSLSLVAFFVVFVKFLLFFRLQHNMMSMDKIRVARYPVPSCMLLKYHDFTI